MKFLYLFLGLAGFLGVAFVATSCAGIGLTRGQYEGPEYEVTKKSGSVEVRQYQPFTVVSTGSADVEQEQKARNGGFMTLFRYIDGGNEAEQKIAMTTPVFMKGDAVDGEMSFVVPAAVVESGTPTPTSEAVRIGEMSGGSFAVLRFRGSRSNESATAAVEELRAWITDSEFLEARDAEPMFAYYDPPWIPERLRRNEVLVPVIVPE